VPLNHDGATDVFPVHIAKTGEVSVADLAVLSHDELPEFPGIMYQAHPKSPKNFAC
jgi:hypothetical protein